MARSVTPLTVLLGGLIGLGALAICALVYDVLSGGRLGLTSAPPLPPTPAAITITIAGDQLAIPANMLRFADQRRPGAHPKAELALLLPNLDGVTEQNAADFATTGRDGKLVFITLQPSQSDLETSERIATIYQRFLAAGEFEGPDGLLRRDFLAGSSYDGEQLYFEPGSVRPFAARCFPAGPGLPPLACLRDVRIGKGLTATIRFPSAELPRWRALAERLDALLGRISVTQ